MPVLRAAVVKSPQNARVFTPAVDAMLPEKGRRLGRLPGKTRRVLSL